MMDEMKGYTDRYESYRNRKAKEQQKEVLDGHVNDVSASNLNQAENDRRYSNFI